MAENRNITWNVTLIIDPKVTTPYPLSKYSANLEWGKWASEPPSQIAPTDTQPVSFEAEGASCSATGTQGTVVFESGDSINNPTTFTFTFDIPYSSANSGGLTIDNSANGNYKVTGGTVPTSGNSVSANVTITQIGPIV